MRWLVYCLYTAALAQSLTPRQGEVVRLPSLQAGADSARMAQTKVRLFPPFGLFPIPVDQKPSVYPLEILDKNGAVLQRLSITVRDAHYPEQNIILKKELAELKPSPGETEATTAFRNNVSNTRYWSEPLLPPVSGCMTSLFGVKRLHNGKPTGSFHGGVDLRAAAGSPVRAAAAGVVRIAQQYNLHGGTIGIDHGQGFESMYLHLSKFAVSSGAMVKAGDIIGYAGSTGRSTAPHLHWSLYVSGLSVNPGQWVSLQACAAKTPPRRRKLKT